MLPYIKEYEVAHGLRNATEEPETEAPHHKCHFGMCPVKLLIIISMIGQLVLLKKHERALNNLKTLKRAKEIYNQNATAETEAQPQYVPAPATTDANESFNYSVEEPDSPKIDDKSGSDLVFQFTDRDIKISGINESSGSITVSNNMV